MKTLSASLWNSISLAALLLLPLSAAAEEVNSIVAKVGDATVTAVELDRYISPTLKSYAKLMPDDPQIREEYREARVSALRSIIDNLLLVREADKFELAIPPIEIDKQISKEKERYSSEEEFQSYLKENSLTMEEYRKHISDTIKAQAMLSEKVFKRIRVLPHEIHKFYLENKDLFYNSQESVHLYQILIKNDQGEPVAQSAKSRAEALRAQLMQGANFQQLALMHSEGPMRDSGGDWGLIERGHFGEDMANVEAAAFALAPGECSQVLETRFGYHIVYVSSRRPAHVQTEREAYEDIVRRLSEDKSAKVYEPYMNSLRRGCSVEIFDPELAAARPEVKPGKKVGDFTRKAPKTVEEPKASEEAESKPAEEAEKEIESKPLEEAESAPAKAEETPAFQEDSQEGDAPADILKELDQKLDKAATTGTSGADGLPAFDTGSGAKED